MTAERAGEYETESVPRNDYSQYQTQINSTSQKIKENEDGGMVERGTPDVGGTKHK